MINVFLAITVYFLCGSFTFFAIFNRIILQMEQGRLKSTVTYTWLICSTGIPSLFAFFHGLDKWSLVPGALLTVFLIGDLNRRFFQKRYKRPPSSVEAQNPSNSKFFTTKALQITRYNIYEKSLSKPLRILQMTDLHADQYLPLSYYENAVNRANNLHPDFVILTGDFADDPESMRQLSPILANLKPKYRTLAVLGNHDYWAGAEAIRSHLEDAGIEIVSGRSSTFDHFGSSISFYGTDKPWGPDLPFDYGLSKGMHIVLSHTPDNIYSLIHKGADIVFSGHLHGGQWRFPILGSLVSPSIHGRLLDYGHFLFGKTHLFVSSGLGTVWMPFRIRCCPEILCVDVQQKAILKTIDPECYQELVTVQQESHTS